MSRLLVKVFLAVRLVPLVVIALPEAFVTDATPGTQPASQQKVEKKREKV